MEKVTFSNWDVKDHLKTPQKSMHTLGLLQKKERQMHCLMHLAMCLGPRDAKMRR